ncbi:MAG: MATE family efflux transporter [Deltaproteobacteria bacterium]|nr:MATE family efflux transporter [Deltaproteobacteria bacterium]
MPAWETFFRETRPLAKLALPVSVSYLASMAMNIVDTIFVGRLGPTELGGVSLGNAVFSVFMVFGIGVLSGLDFFISRDFGARRFGETKRWFVNGLAVAAGFALPCVALMWKADLLFAAFGIEAAVTEQAMQYLRTLSVSLLPFLLFMVLRQYLQAFGVASPVMLVLIAANVLNAVANWVLIYGKFGFPAMGVRGSATATIVARAFILVVLFAYLAGWSRRSGYGGLFSGVKLARAPIRQILALGAPAGFQMLLEVGVFATATFLAGKLGAVPLAAHQIVLQIASLTFMIPLGISTAASVLVGRAIGAGDHRLAARRGWNAFAVGVALMGCVGLLLFSIAGPAVRVFTDQAPVLAAGAALMPIVAFFQVFDATQVIGAGALRGAGSTKASMLANLFGHWFVGLPLGAAICFGFGWGLRGIWIGLSLGLIVVALVLVAVWRRKNDF